MGEQRAFGGTEARRRRRLMEREEARKAPEERHARLSRECGRKLPIWRGSPRVFLRIVICSCVPGGDIDLAIKRADIKLREHQHAGCLLRTAS